MRLLLTMVLLGGLTSAHASNLALGDSIALGTGHALRLPTVASAGAGSCAIARWPLASTYSHVVLSAGINDNGACVAAVRRRLHARRVIWVVPAPINRARGVVLSVAWRYGDALVFYACPGGMCSKRNFHPASYSALAQAVRKEW